MRIKLFFLSQLYILAICQSVFGQGINFKNFSVEQGLAQSYVLDINQDDDGYLWFSTASGISRFDGINFKHYFKRDGLAENYTLSGMIDNEGKIWFGHSAGHISILNRVSDSITIFEHKAFDNTKVVYKIYQDSEGVIWIATIGNGVYRLEGDSLKNFKNGFFENHMVFDIQEDKNGHILFATNGGISALREKEAYLDSTSYLTIAFKEEFLNSRIRVISTDQNNDLWIGTGNSGFHKLIYDDIININKGRYQIKSFGEKFEKTVIRDILSDKKGNTWITTSGSGVIKYYRDEQEIDHLRSYMVENNLSNNNAWSLLEDNEGNIWIGTQGGGVCKYSGELFENYTIDDGLVGKSVFTIFEDSKQNFWIGTQGKGISVFKYNEINGLLSHSFNLTMENGLSNNRVRSIIEDNRGNIWIGLWGTGIDVYNPVTKTIKTYTHEDGLSGMHISDIKKDTRGNIYVANTNSLDVFQARTNSFTPFEVNGKSINKFVRSILFDKENVWIATNGSGLMRYDGQKLIQYDKDNSILSGSQAVYCLAADGQGGIWIGTGGEGVYKYNGEEFENYTTEDGLVSDEVYIITTDFNGNIWVGTAAGMNKIDAQGNIDFYGKNEGFGGIETNVNAVLKDSNKNMWFGTIKGFAKCDVRYDKINKNEPILNIKSVEVKDIGIVVPTTPDINFFPYYANEIKFNWMGISHTFPEKVLYQFMLKGKDEAWRPVSDKTDFTYTNLDPGNYSFMIKSSNSDGLWNEEPSVYDFAIKTPWYKTIFAYLLYVMVAMLIIYTFFKYRMMQVEKEKKILEDKVTERTEELVKEKNKVEDQKAIIEQKNQDITDSIHYAQRIQKAILPTTSIIQKSLKDTFVLFRPKDIVSGDFYWFKEIEDKAIIAAVDCTGHGVPGGFMSMIGNTMLNKVVNELDLPKPSDILFNLRDGVIKSLNQGGEESKDGMDMSLCVFHKEKLKVEYAGAFNSLYLVRNGELIETKADKQPIGTYYSKDDKPFTNHEIDLQKGDAIYLFSDGYADQFGGPLGKKFRYKQFRELLVGISHESPENQKQILNQTIEKWMGDKKQVDDILVIGIKV